MVLNCAHRGASGYYKENSMLAFEKAIEMGCDAIETDVHLSKDGRLVLIHDERVDRTTNRSGYVADFTYKELSLLGVPSLEQFIVLAKRWNTILVLDIKTGPTWYDGIEEKVIETVKKYNMVERTIVSSFNHEAMAKVKRLCPVIQIGLIYIEVLYKPEVYCAYVGADVIHPFYPTLSKRIVEEIHRAGFKVCPYTVNSERALRRIVDMGVNMIITDYPNRLSCILKEQRNLKI